MTTAAVITEEKMQSILADAVELYRHEVIINDVPRSPATFARDYVAHLYSVMKGVFVVEGSNGEAGKTGKAGKTAET